MLRPQTYKGLPLSMKRLIGSAVAVVALLAVAGVLELLLLAFPATGEAEAEPEQVAEQEEAIEPEDPEAEEVSPSPEMEAPESSQPEPESARPAGAEDPRAAALVKTGSIVVDGKPLTHVRAADIVEAASPFTDDVEYIDQRPILPAGCEAVALAVALRAEGYDADPLDIVENHLNMDGSERAYSGSPWESGGGLPPCIVDAGNSWLAGRLPSARVLDLTGTTFDGVLELVALGYPVQVWITEDMAEPSPYGATQDGLEWYFPEHSVVVYGVSADEVLVSDSMAGLVSRNRADFERLYGECGNMALFVLPSAL